jgi:hypothetical protein
MAPTLGAEPVTGTASDLEKRFELSRTYTQGSDLEKAKPSQGGGEWVMKPTDAANKKM